MTTSVLVVIDSLGHGGAEHLLVSLLPALKARGVDAEVAVLWSPDDLASDLERAGVRVHRLMVHHRWAVPEALVKLARLCRRVQPAAVWGHLYFGTLYTRLLKMIAPRRPVVSSLHSFIYEYCPATSAWSRVRERADKMTGRYLADRLVAVSHAVAANYGRHMNWTNIGVIPNGVPVADWAPLGPDERAAIRAAFGVRAHEFLIVYPGRYTEEKGHRYLIEAMKPVRDGGSGVPAVLVAPGHGPLQQELRDLVASLGLAGHVRLVAPLPQDRLFSLIRAADLVVMPSLAEGMSMAATEAMALGAPVVLTAIESFLELAGDAGAALLVPPREPAALASAIARLAGDADLRLALGRAGWEHVRAHFDIERIADDWARELVELTGRRA